MKDKATLEGLLQARNCICSSIPPLMSLLVCASWPPTLSKPPIHQHISSKSCSSGMHAGGFGWSSFKRIMALNLLTVFSTTGVTYLPFLKKPPGNWVSAISSSDPIPHDTAERWSVTTGRIRNDLIPVAVFSLDDFAKQLALYNNHSNNFPMRPLYWLSPLDFTIQYV